MNNPDVHLMILCFLAGCSVAQDILFASTHRLKGKEEEAIAAATSESTYHGCIRRCYNEGCRIATWQVSPCQSRHLKKCWTSCRRRRRQVLTNGEIPEENMTSTSELVLLRSKRHKHEAACTREINCWSDWASWGSTNQCLTYFTHNGFLVEAREIQPLSCITAIHGFSKWPNADGVLPMQGASQGALYAGCGAITIYCYKYAPTQTCFSMFSDKKLTWNEGVDKCQEYTETFGMPKLSGRMPWIQDNAHWDWFKTLASHMFSYLRFAQPRCRGAVP